MQILIYIDQKASLLAGEEAPNSTELFDMPVKEIPETMRKLVVDSYDVYRKHLKINGKSITLAKPITVAKVRGAIEALYNEWLQAQRRSRR